MKGLFFLLLALSLLSCAAMPVSTQLHLSQYGRKEIAALRPEDIRVQVNVPVGFEINPQEMVLRLAFRGVEQSIAESFELVVLSQGAAEIPGGWFSSPIRTNGYELGLSSKAQGSFRKMQDAFGPMRIESVNYAVDWKFEKIPSQTRGVKLWIGVTLQQGEEPIVLFDGAEILFN